MPVNPDIPIWRQLLTLGEIILHQPTVQDQAETLRKYMEEGGVYRVDVWFSESISRLPGQYHLAPFPFIPPSPLMERAARNLQICVKGKKGKPGLYNKDLQAFTVAIPMVVQQSLVGVIQVSRADNAPFLTEEVELLEGLSAHAAVALQMSHHTIIKNWRLEQLALLRSVSAQISKSQSLEELANEVTCLIRQAFDYHVVSIYILETITGKLLFQGCSVPEENQKQEESIRVAPSEKSVTSSAAREGREIVVGDVTRRSRVTREHLLAGTLSAAAFPLQVEGHTLGVLEIQSQYLNPFHEMDLLVLRSLVDNIALAVESTRLYSRLQRRVEELATVAEVGRALSSILDIDLLFNQVVNIIHEKYHFPYVHLFLIQPDVGKIFYKTGAGERSRQLNLAGLSYSLGDEAGIIPWVARNGKTLIANNVKKEKKYRPSPITPSGTSAEIAIPLIFGSEVQGVLDIQSEQINSFDENDKFLFEALADTIAIAIRNAKLYNAERWRRKASDSLREVAGLLSSNAELDLLLEAVLQELEKSLPCSASAIWFVNDGGYHNMGDSTSMHAVAVHGLDANRLNAIYVNNPDASRWLLKTLFSDEPLVRSISDPLDPLAISLNFDQEYSAIAAPLKVGSQPLGVLVLVHETGGRYGKESALLTATFASYTAVAIQNARLYSSAQEQAWVSTVLLQVADATQSLASIEELLAAIVRLTPMLVGVKSCAVFLWEEKPGFFSLESTYGFILSEGGLINHQLIDPLQAPALSQVLQNGSAVFIEDLAQAIPRLQMEGPIIENTRMVLLPLVSRGNVLGAYLVAYTQSEQSATADPLESERLTIIQGIAHQAAIAIENIRLMESQQQETYISAALLQVAQTVVSSNNLEDLFASIVQITPILAGSEICLIYLWDEQGRLFQLAEFTGIKRQLLEDAGMEEVTAAQFPLLERVRNTNKQSAIFISEAGSDQPLYWTWVDDPEDASAFLHTQNTNPLLIGIPLSVKNEVFGVLVVKDLGKDKIYFQKRLELLTGIAQQTALAIQNDRLQSMEVVREQMERELVIARNIQKTFLPAELPAPPGWKMDVRWRTAREVGGDFYDVFTLPDGRIVALVADVTDKGMSAALYMTVTHTLLRTVSQQVDNPAEILYRVNELLLRDTPHGMFITAFLGILDRKNGEFIYSNAGHNLPICRHPDGRLEKLLKGGMPLGIMEDLTLQGHTFQFGQGDSLILFTDGVTEASTATDYFGDQRLEAAIINADGNEPEQILDSIEKALVQFQGSETPSDDVTILALHRCEILPKD